MQSRLPCPSPSPVPFSAINLALLLSLVLLTLLHPVPKQLPFTVLLYVQLLTFKQIHLDRPFIRYSSSLLENKTGLD